MKFWGLFGKVAHIAHTTQQNFLIGPCTKMDTSHLSIIKLQYLNQFQLPFNQIFNMTTSLRTLSMSNSDT